MTYRAAAQHTAVYYVCLLCVYVIYTYVCFVSRLVSRTRLFPTKIIPDRQVISRLLSDIFPCNHHRSFPSRREIPNSRPIPSTCCFPRCSRPVPVPRYTNGTTTVLPYRCSGTPKKISAFCGELNVTTTVRTARHRAELCNLFSLIILHGGGGGGGFVTL